MKKLRPPKFYLRVFAAVVLFTVVLLFGLLALFTTTKLHGVPPYLATEGKLVIEDERLDSYPGYLNGQWEFYEKVCEKEQDTKLLLEEATPVSMPVTTITQAKRNGSYRLLFRIEKEANRELYLFIPNLSGEYKLFLNGVLMEQLPKNEDWVDLSEMHAFRKMDNLKEEQQWQELIISGRFEEELNTLYKRPVIIGTHKNVTALAMFDSSNQLLLAGIFLLVIINGFVFMLFRPSHTLISLITIFDSLIMGRIFFSMNYFIAFIRDIFPWVKISDETCVAGILFFLMLGGFIGCVLSGQLFDPEKKAPRWLTWPPLIAYLIYAVIFPANTIFFENIGSKMLIVTYLITFTGVFWQFIICWKTTEKKGYFLFQFIKTVYLGMIVFVDICNFNNYVDFFALFYLYAIFFIMHVVVRLYDNNESYSHVELLNRNLESIVEMRTQELSKANQILSELSIRDPLTGAFNRLYFETALEKAMTAHEENHSTVYLCMFDLDFFKKVNDTYGHDEGDEQLKDTTAVVSEIIAERAVFARIGGEEFVILFVDNTEDEVMESINLIRQRVENKAKANIKRTTASFGVAKLGPQDTGKVLMKNADIALYEAKNSGRNCIVAQWNMAGVK